jgi:hypothetical protein
LVVSGDLYPLAVSANGFFGESHFCYSLKDRLRCATAWAEC